MSKQVRVLVLGAHPDDCEFMAGGLAALYVKHGHVVKFVSMTNGDTGHFSQGGGALARRREAESKASGRVLGIEYDVIDQHSGELLPTLENRKLVIRLIRLFRPDLVLTHTPDDYHPDHRYTCALVQDSAYSVTVPMQVPLTPHLSRNPYYGYIFGTPTKGESFRPDIIVPIDDVWGRKLKMMLCHESQFAEWGPYNNNCLNKVPKGKADRKKWLMANHAECFGQFAAHYRDLLVAQYGEAAGRRVKFAEGVQACPFGETMGASAVARLFPFLPEAPSVSRASRPRVARPSWPRVKAKTASETLAARAGKMPATRP
jgi:N-acetylglucosamine malate deacetylase 1